MAFVGLAFTDIFTALPVSVLAAIIIIAVAPVIDTLAIGADQYSRRSFSAARGK
jgi:hypothetical protein